MKTENQPRKKPSPKRNADVERLNQALPPLIKPVNRSRMPNEPAQIYYARMEPFRRICEARAVLRWVAGGQFDPSKYVANVTIKRGKKSATTLKNDVLDLYRAVIERDSSLHDFLHPQLDWLI